MPNCIRDGHALAVQHLDLPQLRYNVFRFLSFSSHSLVLLKSGYFYPSGWTTFRGLFHGHLFACEADGIAPDILCIAKGLGAGYQPIGAMLCTSTIYDAIAEGTGFFQHGHTYLGHPVAAAAGRAVLQEIYDHSLVQRVREVGDTFQKALNETFAQHSHVGDIRGRGLFWGIEFVADRETRTPFDPQNGYAGKLKQAAFAEGLICYPMPGTRDGQHGDHVLLAPPFIMSDSPVDEVISRLERAVGAVFPG
ncbi:hypothetical protein DD557_11960 [Thalassobacter stenotrophicus]|nr:hypothetical protein DD557_11960 [Thalassobacter stenotrophicus]